MKETGPLRPPEQVPRRRGADCTAYARAEWSRHIRVPPCARYFDRVRDDVVKREMDVERVGEDVA
jgi:hypothetical protein